jgi:hypothetical protein
MKAEAEWYKKAKLLSDQNAERIKASPSPPVLKLTIELVPQPSWGRSLAKLAPREAWLSIRREAFEKHGGRCAICGTAARYGHEVWEYDDATHIQRLRDIIPICELCHLVKHTGRTSILAAQGKVVEAQVLHHFLQVNGCDLTIYHEHRRTAFRVWRERSRHKWAIDWGPYAHLLRQQ